MKETEFKDRVPKYPGRVILTKVEGLPDTYVMTRADEPTEPGTPLNKATFNSIVHSRLNGRYYIPTYSRNVYSNRTGLTTNILTGTWVLDAEDNNKAVNGTIIAEASSNNGSAWTVEQAFRTAGWQSSGGDVSWIQIYMPTQIKVLNIRFGVEFQYSARFNKLTIQGSNNGTSWNSCGELTSISTGVIEYKLATPGEYMWYRLYFENSDSNRVTVKSLSFSLYDIISYTNAFEIEKGFPAYFTEEQKVSIKTPGDISSLAIAQNTLNGIKINTILQSNKRYELIYNNSAFNAKEV